MIQDHLPLACAYNYCDIPEWDSKPFCFIVFSDKNGSFDVVGYEDAANCIGESAASFRAKPHLPSEGAPTVQVFDATSVHRCPFSFAGESAPSLQVFEKLQRRNYNALYNLRFDINWRWHIFLRRIFQNFGIKCAV